MQQLPWPLDRMEWTDQPPVVYEPKTLAWIAQRHQEAGRLNAWTCEVCGTPFIAFDRHPGVTPFVVAHQTFDPDTDCKGSCVSGFYTSAAVYAAAKWYGQQQVTPSHEWYRPSSTEFKAMSGGMKAHVAQGGLALRLDDSAPRTSLPGPTAPAANTSSSGGSAKPHNQADQGTAPAGGDA